MEREESHTTSPVFIGGTGRCGTHAVAALVGRSGRYAPVPAELRLHVAADGLAGFVDGSLSRRQLLQELRTHWWRHRPSWDPSIARGVHRIAPLHRYATALARLAASLPGADRTVLSRRFVNRLLGPLAPDLSGWVEKSPDNCAAGATLIRLFPRMRLIHVIRDGRDVACSFMRVPWAPDDFPAALALWERRLLQAHRGTLQVPEPSIHRVLLEDLVARDRDRGYRTLLEFLEIPGEPSLRAFFEGELTPPRACIGRWRSDLPLSEHDTADSLFRESLDRLRAAGVSPLPPAEQGTPSDPDGLSSIDPWAAATASRRSDPAPTF